MEMLPTRLDIIRRTPKGAIGAEVGVWRGYFASEMLGLGHIKKLYCIDAWAGQTGMYGLGRDKTVSEHEADLALTKRHLRHYLHNGQAEIIRGMSIDVAKNNASIPPLDFVYIDADHNYQPVLDDLNAWSKRVKPQGVLIGHDYTKNPQAVEWGFGVIEAVTDFCAQGEWTMIHLTNEDFASYCLQRRDWIGAEL
jgi:hypothetical protein